MTTVVNGIGAERPAYLNWSERPPALQNRVQKAFASVAQESESNWGIYNGREEYLLCEVREYELMKKIIRQAPSHQTDFYALDVGAGNFQWGRGLTRFMNQQSDLPKGVKVHVIGIRGEQFLGNSVVQVGRCAMYRLGAFKIEDLSTEFPKRGLDVAKKIDLVVSHWCFRHLADPVGTFVQTYNLLRPKTGFLLTDGFIFTTQEGDPKEMSFNRNMTQLFLDTKAPFLTKRYDMNRSLDHFMLRRPDERVCQLPMRYKGFLGAGIGWQIGSNCITQFERDPQPNDQDALHPRSNRYAMRGDKGLHDWLKQNRLLYESDSTWEPLHTKDAHRGQPYLHAAVLRGDRREVAACLRHGCDIDESDLEGRTPLHLAVQTKNKEIFNLLLEQKADVNLKTKDYQMPLHEAARVDTEGSFVRGLIRRGAAVNMGEPEWRQRLDGKNISPLRLAIEAKNTQAIWQLLKAGATPSVLRAAL